MTDDTDYKKLLKLANKQYRDKHKDSIKNNHDKFIASHPEYKDKLRIYQLNKNKNLEKKIIELTPEQLKKKEYNTKYQLKLKTIKMI